jgi:hypothetical protein
MTVEERAAWSAHFERLNRLFAEGTAILVGPTLGRVNTGIAISEASDETGTSEMGGVRRWRQQSLDAPGARSHPTYPALRGTSSPAFRANVQGH